MPTVLDRLKKQLTAAKKEFASRRKILDKQYWAAIDALKREYRIALSGVGGSTLTKKPQRKGRKRSGRKYGAIRPAVLKALAGGVSLRTAEIAKKAKLGISQARAALFALKKNKQVKSKAGTYKLVRAAGRKK